MCVSIVKWTQWVYRSTDVRFVCGKTVTWSTGFITCKCLWWIFYAVFNTWWCCPPPFFSDLSHRFIHWTIYCHRALNLSMLLSIASAEVDEFACSEVWEEIIYFFFLVFGWYFLTSSCNRRTKVCGWTPELCPGFFFLFFCIYFFLCSAVVYYWHNTWSGGLTLWCHAISSQVNSHWLYCIGFLTIMKPCT